MQQKIKKLLSRLVEVEALLSHPEAFNDQKKAREIGQEHSYLSKIRDAYQALELKLHDLKDAREMVGQETDLQLAEEWRAEAAAIEEQVAHLEAKIQNLLVPPDPNDDRNTIMELRAGTGGDEAALFVGDCVRMYQRFADIQKWKYELLSCTESEMGGYKEYVMLVSGSSVHRLLQFEAGTHRVQRVPETEAQGRVHTSAITIAVLLEPDENTNIVIDERELRIDTYRSSGAGGQHVNCTDSAVRITHIPTNIVVTCQAERSQHKNKDRAMGYLKAKLYELQEEKKIAAMSSVRSSQVGSGDRSERIRTYNFPQNRLTDHRINLTTNNLKDGVMNGQIEDLVTALVSYFYQQKLSS